MSNTQQCKRIIIECNKATGVDMGNVTTCFKSLEMEDQRPRKDSLSLSANCKRCKECKDNNNFEGIFCISRSGDESDNSHDAVSDNEDYEDDGWSYSDDSNNDFENLDDLWNSFKIPSIPYADLQMNT